MDPSVPRWVRDAPKADRMVVWATTNVLGQNAAVINILNMNFKVFGITTYALF